MNDIRDRNVNLNLSTDITFRNFALKSRFTMQFHNVQGNIYAIFQRCFRCPIFKIGSIPGT